MKDDAQLMTQFYAGQDWAFNQLCKQHGRNLVTLAYCRLPSYITARHQRAEDLTQETLFCASNTRQAESGRWIASRGSVKTWLYAILKYRIITFLRTKRGKERLDADLASADQPGLVTNVESRMGVSSAEPWRTLAVHEDHEKVERAISRLAPDERFLVHQKFILGRTQTEIARELGRSTPTISRQVDRALRALRHAVDELYQVAVVRPTERPRDASAWDVPPARSVKLHALLQSVLLPPKTSAWHSFEMRIGYPTKFTRIA